MISLEEVCAIHELSIQAFGGSPGIRDKSQLLAAIQRPYVTFDNTPLYPTPVEKAAAIAESLIKNHPFMDGNKRIGFILMRLTLLRAGLDIVATEKEKYQFIIRIAEGFAGIEDIKWWIKAHIK